MVPSLHNEPPWTPSYLDSFDADRRCDEIWPESQELHRTRESYLSGVTRRVIATAIHGDVSEPEVRQKRVELLPGGTFEVK